MIIEPLLLCLFEFDWELELGEDMIPGDFDSDVHCEGDYTSVNDPFTVESLVADDPINPCVDVFDARVLSGGVDEIIVLGQEDYIESYHAGGCQS